MSDKSNSTQSLVTQTGNRARGHIAGNDVYDVRGDFNQYAAPVSRESRLSQLYRKLKEEAQGDCELSEYIKQLEIYTRVVKNEDVIGLDGKLTAAKRADQLEMAMIMKENIYAQLRENLFSRTFQTIYAIIMGKIWEEFISYVKPAILRGATREEVDSLINIRVIKPISAELDDCDGYDGVANTDVRGMLYFLTGNCHILWH